MLARMNVLGIACPFWHDPSAALVVDGEVVAAAEQERFSRRKHAPRELPVEAARWCLDFAGLRPEDVDAVAYPWSVAALRRNLWPHVRRYFGRRPGKALKAVVRVGHNRRRRVGKLAPTLKGLGFDPDRVRIAYVEHHLAHAAASVHASGFEDCAVASIDGIGELTTCLFGTARGGRVETLTEIQRPDSLGLFYAAITDYLGFEVNDGEFKVMGMAAYGDPSRVDLSDLLVCRDGDLWLDIDYLWTPKARRWHRDRTFGRRFVERFGPPREGDAIDEPYVHIAAAAQQRLEEASIALIEHHLGPRLRSTRRLCLTGGVALNVVLNRKLMQHPWIDEIYVPPSPGDAGTALGAAAWAAMDLGDPVKPLRDAYLGPAYDGDSIARELEGLRIPYQRLLDPAGKGASLLAAGEVVAWFQGRMEWGPRALGNRSILGHPGKVGTADDINTRIKYRERWRPFCPSVLEEYAADFLGSKHPSPFMTLSFDLPRCWRERTPEVTHVDGTVRPHVVSRAANPRFHQLISEFERHTGLPAVINTSLNRRGEPMVCSPRDALAMFFASGLEHAILEDVYLCKSGPRE
jgi:carbamoyltransferase